MKQVVVFERKNVYAKTPAYMFKKIQHIYINYAQENMILFCLNTKLKIIHREILFKGGLSRMSVDIRTIYRVALKKNAHAIILAHNHPSGDLKPSNKDIKFFKRIKKAGKILGCECLDSIIFNRTSFYSMMESKKK